MIVSQIGSQKLSFYRQGKLKGNEIRRNRQTEPQFIDTGENAPVS
jgi:hypothetical protein